MPWLPGLRVYLASLAAASLAWEAVHIRLYTLWVDGTAREIAFAVLHCTAGDLLIALAAITLGLLLVGDARWPLVAGGRVAVVATAVGVGWTVFSEWLNIVVRGAWAYGPAMPLVPVPGTDLAVGLSPVLQWVLLPPTCLWFARRVASHQASRVPQGA